MFKKTPDSPEKLKKILNPTVKKWFFSRFKEFSLPQLYGVSEIHSRNNILVSAPTGATKTLTGFLGILNELVDSAQKGILQDKVYCIYVSPLKALNEDIRVNLVEPLKEIEEIYGKELGIRVAVRTGDTTTYERQKMVKRPPHILITTPESLAILLSSVKFVEHLHNVEWCIIDEIHAIAENKRGVHLSLLLEHLSQLSDHMCRIGLSATVAPLERIAEYLVGPKRDCKIVDVQFIKQLDLKVLSPVDNLVNTTYSELHTKTYNLLHELVQKHKTTLIFTNTRAATERVVDYLKNKYPKDYTENIGAHHGSLSKELRHSIEQRLREGKLKCVVCSTSLELGIDIGYIDLVIMLGSPKSVARALQRCGRSGHQLHAVTKGRIVVMDRDDLVECSVLLKNAVEKKIDKVHIPTLCLDILAQVIDGFALAQVWGEEELYDLIKKSYCYQDLKYEDYNEILSYLAGEFTRLEDRYIFAKIWRKEGKLGRRGKLGRVIYMTNVGTIPDQSFVTVKVGTQIIGKIDEGFLEKLKPGDVFVLGGETYRFRFSRGMVAQVDTSVNRPPTVPRWVSEMLPLSFDLANSIGAFRRLMLQKFTSGKKKKDILKFINEHLYVDSKAANSIYEYFAEQYNYSKKIPNNKMILVETYDDGDDKKVIFHTLFGRRVNDCLSRAVAFAISRLEHRDVEIGMNDNGFFIAGGKKQPNVMKAFTILRSDKIEDVMRVAIDGSEVFKRRFRNCAVRSLMILRNYMGRQKRVGRQQVSSNILMNALKRISNEFSILKEARREVLEDLMDVENTAKVLKEIEQRKIRIETIYTTVPTPFSFNLAMQGYMDIMKIEDKMAFLKRMHEMVLAKISLRKDLRLDDKETMQLVQELKNDEELLELGVQELHPEQEKLLKQLTKVEFIDTELRYGIRKMILGEQEIPEEVESYIRLNKKDIKTDWPKQLSRFVLEWLANK